MNFNSSLSEQEKQFLIETLQKGEALPLDFKYRLFPTAHREYELDYAGKMRKSDILRGEDGVFPTPLQVEKIYNGERELFDDGWRNLIVFGDNLQFLKTCHQNEDEIIKNRVKGKVKLIYIDPPFGTGDEYEGNKGQKGYTARRKSADFVEFIRRRVIVAKELLAKDGVIMVRQGYNFGHYIKVILDEVFGKTNFINEIVVNRGKQRLGGKKKFSTATDSLFFYSNSEGNYTFIPYKRTRYKGEAKGTNMLMKGERNPRERVFKDPDGKAVTLLPPRNTHWKFIQTKIDDLYKKEVMYLAKSQKGLDSGIMKVEGDGKLTPVDYVPSFNFDEDKTIDSNWTDISGYDAKTGYPTENSESLLERVISTTTVKGDLVLDFFGGSGTTAAVAEKLERKWITCDIGKLAYYTIQKRILTIQDSNDLGKTKGDYSKLAKSFTTLNVGFYDLSRLFDLGKDKYNSFVLNLFEVQQYKSPKKIKGYEIIGEKNGSFCLIWEFWKYKSDANVDIDFIEELHSNLKNVIGPRFYIIAPSNAVDFISDYFEIDNTRYYFLKVPYQIIQELHKEQFKKYRQPQSKARVNEVDDVVGFHFTRQPDVKSSFKEGNLTITHFQSNYAEELTNREMDNFESLSLVLIDKNFNGKEFTMHEYFFAEDLLRGKKSRAKKKPEEVEDELEDEQAITEALRKKKQVTLELGNTGNRICVKYIDIYGNEFTEDFQA